MRQKEFQCVLTFQTTTGAMAFEEAARKAGFKGRIIPLPTAISAGCGLAWREDPVNRASLERLLKEYNFKYDKIYELEI